MECKELIHTHSATWNIDMDNVDGGHTLEMAEQQDKKNLEP